MIPRPSIRIPLWAALAIVGAAYLVRGFALRGGDLSPDMPEDIVAFALVAVAVGVVWTARVHAAKEAREAARTGSQHEPDQGNDGPRTA